MEYYTNECTGHSDISTTKNDYVFSDDENDSDQYLVRNFKIMCLFELDIERDLQDIILVE